MPLFAVLVFPLIGGGSVLVANVLHTHNHRWLSVHNQVFPGKIRLMFDRICSIVFVVQNLSVFFPYFHISFNNWKNKYILDHFLHGLSFGPDGRLCQLLWRQTFFHFEILFFLSFWRERFILTIDCLCLATRERNHSLGRFRGKKYQKFSELQKICKYI